MKVKNPIILPLDVDSEQKALDLALSLKDGVGVFKVGMELVNSCGYRILDTLKEHGIGPDEIFLDLKYHDIPNTVAAAAAAATRLGVWMFNVHCSGGVPMMKAAKEASLKQAAELGITPPKVIGVTVLTSLDYQALQVMGFFQDPNAYPHLHFDNPEACMVQGLALNFAYLAKEAGLDGVVCSPHEITAIREACGPDFLIVTPGVRPAGADVNDQKRVKTPGEAIILGADHLVIGRPIIKADDPAAAARAITAEIEEALCVRHSGLVFDATQTLSEVERDPESSKPEEPGMLKSGVPFPNEDLRRP